MTKKESSRDATQWNLSPHQEYHNFNDILHIILIVAFDSLWGLLNYIRSMLCKIGRREF